MKELFEKQAPRTVRRTRHQMYQGITTTYYGFHDEEDGVLLKLEAVAEQEQQQRALAEWDAKERERQAVLETVASGRAGRLYAKHPGYHDIMHLSSLLS